MTSSEKTHKTLMLVWPLLFGMFMIMVGNGLQGTLLGLRAELAGFSVTVIGIIMSLYYCGYMAGWYVVPAMIRSVGHIRVFAGFASLCSTTILVQGLFVDPYTWCIVRLISGLSFVGLFIVAESWLNDIATNKLRAQVLSAYLCVVNGGMFAGQFLINLGPIETMGLFVLVSILISLSLLPITLANKPSPGFQEQEHLPFKKLIRISPLAVASVVASGLIGASMFTLAPVYAKLSGFDLPRIALFMAMYIAGSATIPLAMGWLSDKIDRRKVVAVLSVCAFAVTFMLTVSNVFFMWLMFLFGGFIASIHSISIAMMNDRLRPGQITSATASLILINGMASCVSPILMGVLMDTFGIHVFFALFATVFLVLLIYSVYRAFVGPQIDVEQQGEYQVFPTRAGPNVAEFLKLKKRKKGAKS